MFQGEGDSIFDNKYEIKHCTEKKQNPKYTLNSQEEINHDYLVTKVLFLNFKHESWVNKQANQPATR